MKYFLICAVSALALTLAGCAGAGVRGQRTALVQTGGQTIALDGCKPQLLTVWNHNATIQTDGHLVTVDENYLTVDGQFIRRPAFKNLLLQCAGHDLKVTVDGKNFSDLVRHK